MAAVGGSVRSEWESFVAGSFRGPVGGTQRRDLENTFYAGALAATSLIVSAMLADPETAGRVLDSVMEEIIGWNEARVALGELRPGPGRDG